MKILLVLLLLCPSISFGAKLFDIVGCTAPSTTVCNSVIDTINSSLPATDLSSLTQNFADAAVISQRGLGADYASDLKAIAIGGGVGLGATLGGASIFDLLKSSGGVTLPGLGFGSSLMLGLNMSFLNGDFWKRSNVYINMAVLNPPSSLGINGKFSSFGMHIQYKLVPALSVGLGTFSFGGVVLTTGFEKSSSLLTISQDLSIPTYLTATIDVGTDVKAYSIPLEVSSNVNLFYFMTIFGGLGLDYNWGTSKSVSDVKNFSLAGGLNGTPTINVAPDASPKALTSRYFIGLQFDILAFKISLQYNSNIGSGGVGLTIGTKILF